MNPDPNQTMTNFRIELTGADEQALKILLGEAAPSWGKEFSPIAGINVINKTEKQIGIVEPQTWHDILITYGNDILVSIIASWIYDGLKHLAATAKLRINGKPVEKNVPAIEAAVTEAKRRAEEKAARETKTAPGSADDSKPEEAT